jgi:hypothetical protein
MGAEWQKKQSDSAWKGIHEGAVAAMQERINELEEALRKCEIIADQYQRENQEAAVYEIGYKTKLKARAVAARCGLLLIDQRKIIHAALARENRNG